jgi:hypothetical protein
MADLEQRVAALESEVAALKTRIGAIDDELRALPKLIDAQFRRMDSGFTRVHADIAELKTYRQRAYGHSVEPQLQPRLPPLGRTAKHPAARR